MKPQQIYTDWVNSKDDVPLFMMPWYLDAVYGNQGWDVVLGYRGKTLAAALPFIKENKWGFSIIRHHFFTQTLGIYFSKAFRSLRLQHALTEDIIQQLPSFAYFQQNIYHQNWLPFYWNGFKAMPRYTYVIDDIRNKNKIWKNIDASYRQKIKKANNNELSFECLEGIDEFYDVNSKTFNRQGMDIIYSKKKLQDLHLATQKHEAGNMFGVRDNQGRLCSVAYLLWDNKTAYYLLAGDDPALRQSGSGIFLIWKCIEYLSEKGIQSLDFNGSMIKEVEAVRRRFGAEAIPYLQITKFQSPIFKGLYYLKRGFF